MELDLNDLKTETSDDAAKNQTQAEHMYNWFELGGDSEAKRANGWAHFTFAKLESANPARLADAPVVDGMQTVHLTVTGSLWLHGIASSKTVALELRLPVKRDQVAVRTEVPFRISLQEHDVKPRDPAGKFLNGTLKKIGKKIDDEAQLTLGFTAVQ